MNYEKEMLNRSLWGFCCETKYPCSVMTVQIGFSHKENECDETEFDIEAWNDVELIELFDQFCMENHFKEVSIEYVSVVKMANSFEELE